MFRCSICGVDKLSVLDIVDHDCGGEDSPGTIPITVRVSRQQLAIMQALLQTGLLGSRFGETAERLLTRGIFETLPLLEPELLAEIRSATARKPAKGRRPRASGSS